MDSILEFIDAIVDGLANSILKPFVTDGMYRRGFLTALGVGFVLNWLITRILAARALILAFFQPTASPATRPGPSGYNRATGCAYGLFKLFVLAIVLIIVAAILSVGLFR